MSSSLCPNREVLSQMPRSCFPSAPVNTTAARSVADEYIYQLREQISTNHIPMFMGGGHEGARADLESSLRPCMQRTPAGEKDSIRSKQLPWALATTPQHYLWQPASDLSRDVFMSTRIAAINCSQGPRCQVRSFT